MNTRLLKLVPAISICVPLVGAAACAPAPLQDTAAPHAWTPLLSACETPSQPGRFDAPQRPGPWAQQPTQDNDNGGWGLAVDDFNGDGALDVFLPHWDAHQLFLGDGEGGWLDASQGLPSSPAFAQATAAGDLDADGDIDLVVGADGEDEVWLNDGDGRFTVLPGALANTEGGDWSIDVSLGDLNGDEVLDLFIGTFVWTDDYGYGIHPNRLLFGNGDGSFSDRSDLLPEDALSTPCNAGGFFDFNDDGNLDLYVTADKPHDGFRAVVLLGDGQGGLDRPDSPLGLEVGIDAMGIAEGDINGDGRLDYAITGWNMMSVLTSVGESRWADVAQAHRIETDESRVVGWGLDFLDLDSDGDLDLLAAFGTDYGPDDRPGVGENGQAAPVRQGLALWRNDSGSFTEAAADHGLDSLANHRGFVVADVTGDGHPDLIRRDLASTADITPLACADTNALVVSLRQPNSPNWRAIDAQVFLEAGDLRLRRALRGGSTNIASSGPAEVRFGLGDVERVDALVVRWPDGTEERFTTDGGFPSNIALTLVRSVP